MDFEILWFSQFSLNSKQSKKQRKLESLSHKDFHCFELLGSTNAHDFSIEILKELHWKRTCGKTRISIIIAKTNEIATFWPPIINIKTICFFCFSRKEHRLQIRMKKHQKTWHLRKPSKTNEIATFWPPRTHPRRAPYLQKHPKGLPGPSQDAPREPPPFLVPPGTSQGPPRTPNSCSGRCPFAT